MKVKCGVRECKNRLEGSELINNILEPVAHCVLDEIYIDEKGECSAFEWCDKNANTN